MARQSNFGDLDAGFPSNPAYFYNMGRQPRRPAVQRFDEYYRCYPLVMAPGADRPELNFGSKIILPPSALDKVSKLHVQWPLLMEMINGDKGRHSHAGVLEFIAQEGRAYIPQWMMDTLALEYGDMIQIRTTSLELAKMVKLQPQSVRFLEISDPRAVLEKVFRSFATLTKGDVFNFEYNDEVYAMEVMDVKPQTDKMGVSMIETDVSVEFVAPKDYVEPAPTATSSKAGGGAAAAVAAQSTMAQAINYSSMTQSAPSNFLGEGQRVSKKGSKNTTPKPATPVPGEKPAAAAPPLGGGLKRRTAVGGPTALRLPPNKLFFGYEVVPVKTEGEKQKEREGAKRPRFAGQGQSLRGAVKREEDAK